MMKMRVWFVVILVVALLAAFAWASDFVTVQGERTVYTVACRKGTWEGQQCSGKLVASERPTFRALKADHEVLFWKEGADEPEGKFSGCEVQNGRNWKCKLSVEATRTVTLQMIRGQAVDDPTDGTRPLHAVAKWRWWLLQWGISLGSEADEGMRL